MYRISREQQIEKDNRKESWMKVCRSLKRYNKSSDCCGRVEEVLYFIIVYYRLSISLYERVVDAYKVCNLV